MTASRRPWLATELAFLARACRHLPPAELDTVLQRYTSAAAPAEPRSGAFAVEHKPFGRVVIVHERPGHELPGLGVYLLRIDPGGTIPWHVHRVMDETELVLGTGLLLQGSPVPRGLAVRWPRGHPHAYHNPTAEAQTVLCVDVPAFIPGDEIEVPPPEAPKLPAGVALHRPDGMAAR